MKAKRKTKNLKYKERKRLRQEEVKGGSLEKLFENLSLKEERRVGKLVSKKN